jgi:hypothetical protein
MITSAAFGDLSMDDDGIAEIIVMTDLIEYITFLKTKLL